MPSVHAFVDEYGDTSIAVEKSGVTSFFIVTAVLVSEDVEVQRAHAETLRRKFFQTGEMKSSGVGADDERRLRILEEISSLNIRTYTLAVDKRELYRESGLAYRASFFKYAHRRIYATIYRVYDNVALTADKHGGEAFMGSFESYLDREIPPDLFSVRSFRFADSTDEVLLQIADFLAGSIARVLDPKKRSPVAGTILQQVMKRAFAVDCWPPRSLPAPGLLVSEPGFSENDELIRRHCLRQVEFYLDKNELASASDEQMHAQTELLRFLLFKVKFVDPSAFFSTGEIIDHLMSNSGLRLSEHAIRSTVIAPLRDAGVILASGSEGYKIPVCESDLARFLAHANSIVPPMLARIRRARDDLRMVSNGDLDILATSGFEHLRALVELD
jgi:hypothetical protein